MPTPRRRMRADGASLRSVFAAIRARYQVTEVFPAAVLTEAVTAAREPQLAAHQDCTAIPFVTLDPPGAMDLDQAMHLARTPHGYLVRYAIADVAAFVVPGGAIDRAAHERVLTVYCPDTRAPLHPGVLSEGAASLLPGQTRPAVLWELDLDGDGQLRNTVVRRALVRSQAKLDYESVQRALDGGGARDELPALLAEIGSARARIEQARGGVSLARPEQEVVAQPAGAWRLEFRAPLPVQDHNAQISLLTGMAAAAIMLEGGVGVLRTLPPVDANDVQRLRRQARALGVVWPRGQRYGDVLASLDHRRATDAAFIHAATSLFRGAAWEPFQGAPPRQPVHGAIAAPYAHVTAPLRRLVDRYGLEIALAASAGHRPPTWVLDRLDSLGELMAGGANRAGSVDRACTDAVEAAVLTGRIGQVFDGVALDGRTVQLTSPAVVARVADGRLPAGRRVRVRLTDLDLATGLVRFERERAGSTAARRIPPGTLEGETG